MPRPPSPPGLAPASFSSRACPGSFLLPSLPRDLLPALPDLSPRHARLRPGISTTRPTSSSRACPGSFLLPGLPRDLLPVLPDLSPRHARLRPGISSSRPASSSRACPGISFPSCPTFPLVMPGSDRASPCAKVHSLDPQYNFSPDYLREGPSTGPSGGRLP